MGDEGSCIAGGCAWNAGYPPAAYIMSDDYFDEDGAAITAMLSVVGEGMDGLNSVEQIGWKKWMGMIVTHPLYLLCVAVIICGVYGYYKKRNRYVGYEKLSNEDDRSTLVNNPIYFIYFVYIISPSRIIEVSVY